MKVTCPYCGVTVAVDCLRFVNHSTGGWGNLCPLSKQRVPASGLSEDDDESRAEILSDLAWQVQDADPALVWAYLTCLSGQELQRLLMFSLAALPVDKTVHQMWGWVKQLPVAQMQEAM